MGPHTEGMEHEQYAPNETPANENLNAEEHQMRGKYLGKHRNPHVFPRNRYQGGTSGHGVPDRRQVRVIQIHGGGCIMHRALIFYYSL